MISTDLSRRDFGHDLEQINLLADLSQEFAQSIDIEHTLAGAVKRIADYMNAEAASVFLVSSQDQALVCRACSGPVNVTGIRLAFGQGIVGRAAAENCCQLIRDAQADPGFAGKVDRDTGFITRSMVCTPLNTSAGVIGVLQVLNKRDGGLFDDGDRDTLRLLAAPTALAINNARMASDLLEQKRLKKELFMARRLQRSLLPRRRRDPQYPVMGINLPARQVSGDFYDIFELPDGRIAFTVGDVSGKGMNAALLMVRVSSLLRWIGRSAVSPGQWLADVNNELAGSVSGGMFICALVGYFDPQTSQVVIANAGFPAPLVRRGADEYESHMAAAPPLGIITFGPVAEQRLDLNGASMYLYSDGVSEIRDANSEMIGDDGFKQLIEKFSGRSPKSRLGAIILTLRRMKVIDDTTILLIEGAQR